MKQLEELKAAVWDYYAAHGRHDLPWRLDTSSYSIVISEVMLQQTQVSRVRPKYAEFMAALPSFAALATAPQAQVLQLWQGLGYNRRALRLKQLAELIVGEHSGELPRNPAELQKLPGIGPNTAGSVAAFVFNLSTVFIETNIRRVFLHHCFTNQADVSDKELLPLIGQALVGEQPREWYWALMDYGSYLATQVENPNRRSKHHALQSKYAGSDRQIRGEVLRLLLARPLALGELHKGLAHLEANISRLDPILDQLAQEGFITLQKDHYQIS